jgi:hypothetical protein
MVKKKRNRIVILGNGFDLAHGFKTSYSSFIDWLWDKKVDEINNNKHQVDIDNLFIVSEGKRGKFVNANELKKWIIYQNGLLEALEKKRNELKDPKWSDIEDVYYESLLKCHENYNTEKENKTNEELSINKLNRDFRVLRTKLIEYLKFAYDSVDKESLEFKNLVIRMKTIFNELDANNEEIGKILFICFNYTNTLKLYGYSVLENSISNSNTEIAYIHGSLSDDNSVIFGYGDDLDSYSMNVQENKDNAFLEFNKAVLYARSGEYQRISSFIYGEDDYEVYILGHSCANSDRALLNELFTNDHCKYIKYYYFDGGQGKEANFREQISNLYRIFGNNHRKFRSIFCPLNRSERIPQIRDIENYVVDEGTTVSTTIIEILGIQFVKVQGSVLPDGTRVDDFLIGRFPVTELQWKNVIGKRPIKHKINGDDFPIVGVNLFECLDFIREFSSQTGRKAFLPRLVQWRYAAQGGNVSKNYTFAGSNTLDEVGWYKQNSGNQLHPVGKKKPNELGIYDMSGNVWEYLAEFPEDDSINNSYKKISFNERAVSVLDNYTFDLDAVKDAVTPFVCNVLDNKVLVAGGGYLSPSKHCKTTYTEKKEMANDSIGFRIVIKLDNDDDK